MTISVTDISQDRCATDTADAQGAWMIQRLCSYQNSGPKKPCTWAIEDGYNQMTHGESVDICSTKRLRREDLHVSEAAPKSKYCWMNGKSDPHRERRKKLLRVWKMKFLFWDFPYWKILDTPYSLDQMHITKNVLERLLGTLLNMPEKTKDG